MRIKYRHFNRSGFSLIELLIVIGIIGMLVQLALPAVEMARESARRVHCLNNLRQLGVASQLHIDSQGHFPSGGWTHVWVGDPDRGFSEKQPGGWCYNLLPFIEEEPLRSLPSLAQSENERLELTRQMYETPVAAYFCPSRRLVRPYPFTRKDTLINSNNPSYAGRTDYAANMGSRTPTDQRARGPKTLVEADLWVKGSDPLTSWVATKHDGLVHQRSTVAVRQVTDGLSKTFLFGEKFLSPDQYKTGKANGDDHGIFSGFDRDTSRSTNRLHPPMRDKVVPEFWLPVGDSAQVTDWNFGGAHPPGVNFVMGDGSARLFSYDIDINAYSALGTRNGEEVMSDF